MQDETRACHLQATTGKRLHATVARTIVTAFLAFTATCVVPVGPAHAQASASAEDPTGDAGLGPVRLRQPQATTGSTPGSRSAPSRADGESDRDTLESSSPVYKPGDFEVFARERAGQGAGDANGLHRFGAELMTGRRDSEASDALPRAPADYLLSPGDEVVLTLWGSVDADLRLPVDRSGQITIPRVGPVSVVGVRFADLPKVIERRVGEVFRNFHLSVALGRLRQIRVYVTGFTSRPGSYTVSSLSTVSTALMRAGGPSSAGSYRNIQLLRDGKPLSRFDLYDLLLKGDRSADLPLQPGDVIQIDAAGPQVAMIGSVNKPAIFELRPSDKISDVLRMAGGFTPVADTQRIAVERLSNRNSMRVVELALPPALDQRPENGDVLRVFSAVSASPPVDQQNKRVRVEGEVVRPGEYVVPPGRNLADLVALAGGLTPKAFVYGAEFDRESVRERQQENYERALRDLELSIAKLEATQKTATGSDAAALQAKSSSASQLIARLREVRPTGRIVLKMESNSSTLPPIELEDGDRLYIPPRPTSVGVFGSVFNAGAFLWSPSSRIDDYLSQAGGPTKGGDTSSIFVIRANGTVASASQSKGWFGTGGSIGNLPAEPGDTVFVPEELERTTFLQQAKDWTQILYQFGLGAAALKTIRQ